MVAASVGSIMDCSNLPGTAFISPDGSNRDNIALLLERALEIVVGYASAASSRPTLPGIQASIDDSDLIPDKPVGEDAIFNNLSRALEGSMNAAHPGYIGHMDSLPATMSVVGDLAAAVLNNNMLSVEMSPFASRLEHALLRKFASMFGLGEGSGGVLAGGGTLANLQALALARNVKLGTAKSGLFDLERRPVVLASEESHTSVRKAAMLLGLGTEGVVPVATDSRRRMDVRDLRDKLKGEESSGQLPFCVIGTAGTTVTGNMDPLPEIAEIAREHDLWFHVDAVYGGALVFSDRERHRLRGIELADSISFNPQKWLYVTKVCSMLLLRDMGLLRTHFQTLAPYMRDEDEVPNLGEIGVQGTRHVDVLKLWLTLQHLGQSGFDALIAGAYSLTEKIMQKVWERPYLEIASEPEMNVVCFRCAPRELLPDRWDTLNDRVQTEVLKAENVFLSLPRYRGSLWLRVVLLNPFTDDAILEGLFAAIDRVVQRELCHVPSVEED